MLHFCFGESQNSWNRIDVKIEWCRTTLAWNGRQSARDRHLLTLRSQAPSQLRGSFSWLTDSLSDWLTFYRYDAMRTHSKRSKGWMDGGWLRLALRQTQDSRTDKTCVDGYKSRTRLNIFDSFPFVYIFTALDFLFGFVILFHSILLLLPCFQLHFLCSHFIVMFL